MYCTVLSAVPRCINTWRWVLRSYTVRTCERIEAELLLEYNQLSVCTEYNLSIRFGPHKIKIYHS